MLQDPQHCEWAWAMQCGRQPKVNWIKTAEHYKPYLYLNLALIHTSPASDCLFLCLIRYVLIQMTATSTVLVEKVKNDECL